MKKVVTAIVLGMCAVLTAQDKGGDAKASTPAPRAVEKAPWPVWVSFNSTKNLDVVGMRWTIPYGACESVTGFDFGFFGRCRYFEGLQLNILRNEAEDMLSGIQIGIFNTAGNADKTGVQIGLWNEAASFKGLQVGLVNLADTGTGLQVGVINRAESLYGYQAGGLNFIREAEYSFLPIMNIGFDQFTDPKF